MSELILALECAVGGGSIAILDGAAPIAKSDPERFVPSRAEQVLVAVDALTKELGASLGQFNLIAVSTGPGSYSGIRIGIATALGLRTALGIRCVGVPVLDAMALAAGEQANIITAIPVGKKDVAWQVYSAAKESNGPHLSPEAEFISRTNEYPSHQIYCHSDLFARTGVEPGRLVDAGYDLASMIGAAAASGRAVRDPEPIYLRNTAHKSGF